MSLEKTINTAIKEAMKAKAAGRLRALRAIKSAILLAKTATGGSDEMTEAEEVKILSKLAKQRRDSATLYREQNRVDLAEIEEEELVVIETFLPKQMGAEEVKKAVQEVIEQTGASGPQDIGKVMGVAMKKLAGQADGKLISSIAKELLTS